RSRPKGPRLADRARRHADTDRGQLETDPAKQGREDSGQHEHRDRQRPRTAAVRSLERHRREEESCDAVSGPSESDGGSPRENPRRRTATVRGSYFINPPSLSQNSAYYEFRGHDRAECLTRTVSRAKLRVKEKRSRGGPDECVHLKVLVTTDMIGCG